jgi:Glutathione S-transferase, C-terminal domain
MGASPCGADATVFAWIAGILCPHFATPLRTGAERRANLVVYRGRGMRQWFPEIRCGLSSKACDAALHGMRIRANDRGQEQIR